MILYNKIGNNYARTRTSDPRIATTLLEILQLASINTVVDIGAGTGSYARVLAESGYQVLAVEPSATMRNQANPHPNIRWFNGSAENLPLADRSVDAAIIMLAFHHFQDYRQALLEVHRVTRSGNLAMFTYDPDEISKFWLTRYFPSFIKDVQSTFLPISELLSKIKALTNTNAKAAPFLLPHDLTDSFAAVGWSRPELYLDANIRNGISTFAKLDLTELNDGLLQLKQDLESGAWDREYGYLRQQQYYDVGYRFIQTLESHLYLC
jgi:ubiquinone/menaquinone biosynthesis C-methylase UbiE